MLTYQAVVDQGLGCLPVNSTQIENVGEKLITSRNRQDVKQLLAHCTSHFTSWCLLVSCPGFSLVRVQYFRCRNTSPARRPAGWWRETPGISQYVTGRPTLWIQPYQKAQMDGWIPQRHNWNQDSDLSHSDADCCHWRWAAVEEVLLKMMMILWLCFVNLH